MHIAVESENFKGGNIAGVQILRSIHDQSIFRKLRNSNFPLGLSRKYVYVTWGGRGSSPKCHKMSQILPMGGGSDGLCHMKVGDKIGREAADFENFSEFSQFFSEFCDFFRNFATFLFEISAFFFKILLTFILFHLYNRDFSLVL